MNIDLNDHQTLTKICLSEILKEQDHITFIFWEELNLQ